MSKGTVGFVGLGSMGGAMARNLAMAGFKVLAWNRTTRPGALEQAGLIGAATPAEAARNGIVVSMVADDSALQAVTHGDDGILAGLPQDGLHICMSTVGVQISAALAQVHRGAGRRYLAAPVFGRPDAAAAAKLWIVAAGEAADYARAEPLFQAMGQGSFHVGAAPEQAGTVKLAGNFLLMAMLEALGEAFALTAKAGIAPRQLLDIVNGALFKSPVYENYGRIAIDRKFDPPGLRLRLGLKDANLMLDAANALQVPMPLASLVRDRMLGAAARGMGELDWSVLTRLIAADAGLA